MSKSGDAASRVVMGGEDGISTLGVRRVVCPGCGHKLLELLFESGRSMVIDTTDKSGDELLEEVRREVERDAGRVT